MAFLEREGSQNAPIAIIRQLRRHPSLHSPSPSQESNEPPLSPTVAKSSSSIPATSPKPKPPQAVKPSGWKEPQAFEIFRAVERKDIMFLMSVRDHAFHLLLRKSGDATPLLHAMRCGKSHREVAIILVGALSRWVNHVSDEDMQKPQTKMLLKALRTNLKLAIDHGLQHAQTDLVASYLQTLIMSEGDQWVMKSTASVALTLRVPGPEGKPVKTAGSAIRNFATKELSQADMIAALEDYIANATLDLLMMAAWSLALEHCPGAEPLPTYYFARDDRVFKAFEDRLNNPQNASDISKSAPKRLKWQLKVLEKLGDNQMVHLGMRRKVEILESELDEGIGV